jgi:hypothetical protein
MCTKASSRIICAFKFQSIAMVIKVHCGAPPHDLNLGLCTIGLFSKLTMACRKNKININKIVPCRKVEVFNIPHRHRIGRSSGSTSRIKPPHLQIWRRRGGTGRSRARGSTGRSREPSRRSTSSRGGTRRNEP